DAGAGGERQFDMLDRSSAVDWVLLSELAKNTRAGRDGVVLWRRDGGAMQLSPGALDLSAGSFPVWSCGASGFATGLDLAPDFVVAAAQDPSFRSEVVARWEALRAGAWSDLALAETLAAHRAVADRLLPADAALWPSDKVPARAGLRQDVCHLPDATTAWDTLEAWLPARAAWLDAYLGEWPRPYDVDTTPPEALPPIDHGVCSITLDCFEEIVDEPKVDCLMTLADASETELYRGWAGVEYRGRSSLTFAKKQFAVELREGASDDLLYAGADWMFWDRREAPPADWTELDFDDAAWSVGSAPLGYGDPGVDGVDFGPDPDDKPLTVWFRHVLSVPDAGALGLLTLQLQRDDGAAVYVNGVELVRSNLDPSVELTADTPALGTMSGGDETAWHLVELDPAMLVDGDNLIAVEVHQAEPDSSDLRFDLAISELAAGRSENFFEMGADPDWVVNGAYADFSLFRNAMFYDLYLSFRDENVAAETTFCDLTLNGEYWGAYQLGERLKRDDDRIDIAADEGDGQSFILKNNDANIEFPSDMIYGGWQLVYPRDEDLTPEGRAGIAEWMDGWEDGVYGRGDEFDYIDIDSAVEFVLLQELSRNGDAYVLSVHVWKDRDGKIQFSPWDFDLGASGNCAGTSGWASRQTWVSHMADDPRFTDRLAERWRELRQTVLHDDELDRRLRSYDSKWGVTPEENFDRWPMEETMGAGWVLDFRLSCPVYSHDEEMEFVGDWMFDRVDWLDANIDFF
ncbi:MAG: ketosteroid isomerase-like protein, partial [Myxococcota bacterium]